MNHLPLSSCNFIYILNKSKLNINMGTNRDPREKQTQLLIRISHVMKNDAALAKPCNVRCDLMLALSK